MLASIHPLGERARDRRWGVTVGAYLLGSTLAAALLGALLGGIGSVLPLGAGVTAAGVVALAALALAYDLGIGGLRLPTVHRQVDKDWLGRYRGWVVGAGFGVQLGLGVVTIVNTAAVYLALALALLTGTVAAGAAVGIRIFAGDCGDSAPLEITHSGTPTCIYKRIIVAYENCPCKTKNHSATAVFSQTCRPQNGPQQVPFFSPSSLFASLTLRLPGTLVCVVIALAATFLSEHYGGPQLLYALLIGLAFHFLCRNPRVRPGVDFCGRSLLRIGVALRLGL